VRTDDSSRGRFHALKVIGAGYGRTGTLSLKAALERLGFGPCYHALEVFKHPGHAAFWSAASHKRTHGEPIDWDEIFGSYRATVDFPAAFYEELTRAYPEAKVILTTRDPQSWYDSASSALANVPTVDVSSSRAYLRSELMSLLFPRLWQAMSAMQEMREESDITFDGSLIDRERATREFERHIQEVEKRVPAEKLLVYEVRQGWGPLCEFLGVEAPQEPFPHLNERDQFPKLMRQMRLEMLYERMRGLGKVMAPVSALLLAYWIFRPASRSCSKGK
jgi:Sulfotransferase domain